MTVINKIPDNMRCKNCIFFEREIEKIWSKEGECRFNPPSGKRSYDGFPKVVEGDWCSKFSLGIPITVTEIWRDMKHYLKKAGLVKGDEEVSIGQQLKLYKD